MAKDRDEELAGVYNEFMRRLAAGSQEEAPDALTRSESEGDVSINRGLTGVRQPAGISTTPGGYVDDLVARSTAGAGPSVGSPSLRDLFSRYIAPPEAPAQRPQQVSPATGAPIPAIPTQTPMVVPTDADYASAKHADGTPYPIEPPPGLPAQREAVTVPPEVGAPAVAAAAPPPPGGVTVVRPPPAQIQLRQVEYPPPPAPEQVIDTVGQFSKLFPQPPTVGPGPDQLQAPPAIDPRLTEDALHRLAEIHTLRGALTPPSTPWSALHGVDRFKPMADAMERGAAIEAQIPQTVEQQRHQNAVEAAKFHNDVILKGMANKQKQTEDVINLYKGYMGWPAKAAEFNRKVASKEADVAGKNVQNEFTDDKIKQRDQAIELQRQATEERRRHDLEAESQGRERLKQGEKRVEQGGERIKQAGERMPENKPPDTATSAKTVFNVNVMRHLRTLRDIDEKYQKEGGIAALQPLAEGLTKRMKGERLIDQAGAFLGGKGDMIKFMQGLSEREKDALRASQASQVAYGTTSLALEPRRMALEIQKTLQAQIPGVENLANFRQVYDAVAQHATSLYEQLYNAHKGYYAKNPGNLPDPKDLADFAFGKAHKQAKDGSWWKQNGEKDEKGNPVWVKVPWLRGIGD